MASSPSLRAKVKVLTMGYTDAPLPTPTSSPLLPPHPRPPWHCRAARTSPALTHAKQAQHLGQELAHPSVPSTLTVSIPSRPGSKVTLAEAFSDLSVLIKSILPTPHILTLSSCLHLFKVLQSMMSMWPSTHSQFDLSAAYCNATAFPWGFVCFIWGSIPRTSE